jgi:hypothetical protein
MNKIVSGENVLLCVISAFSASLRFFEWADPNRRDAENAEITQSFWEHPLRLCI